MLIRNFGGKVPHLTATGVKTLGRKLDGLWQINLKVEKRQVRDSLRPIWKRDCLVQDS